MGDDAQDRNMEQARATTEEKRQKARHLSSHLVVEAVAQEPLSPEKSQALGSVVSFRPIRRRSEAGAHIARTPNDKVVAGTIRAMMAHLDDMSGKDRSFLIDEAIMMLGAEGPPQTYPRSFARDTIAQAYLRGYLDMVHQARLFGMGIRQPQLNHLLAVRIRQLQAE